MTTAFTGWPRVPSTVAASSLASNLGDLSVAAVCTASVVLIMLVVAAVIAQKRWPRLNAPLFSLIVIISLVTTTILGGGAVTANLNSATGGPVNWGSDYQIWACDNQLELRDPRGLVGKHIGSPTLFEQNDGRIHFSGTPQQLPDDASLGKFMSTIGGEISDTTLVVPLNDQNGFAGTPATPDQVQPYLSTDANGVSARFVDGQKCGATAAEVQVFVYHYNTDTKTYFQTKQAHPATYELSHNTASPPGDCVIIEFAAPKDRTDHLCAGYGVRDYNRCTDFGVAADKISSCDIREVQ